MFYSLKTNNKSFIDEWHHLQRLEYENNTFMLQTIDKDLVNFKLEDLHIEDKNTRNTLIEKVKKEILNNVWFFFREIVRIPQVIYSLNTVQTPYILNYDELKLIYSYTLGNSVLCNKSDKQKRGLTTTIILLNIYENYKNDCNSGSSKIINSYIFNDLNTDIFFANMYWNNINNIMIENNPFSSNFENITYSIKCTEETIQKIYNVEDSSKSIGFFYFINDYGFIENKKYYEVLSIGTDKDIFSDRYPIYAIIDGNKINIKGENIWIQNMFIFLDGETFNFDENSRDNLTYKNKILVI